MPERNSYSVEGVPLANTRNQGNNTALKVLVVFLLILSVAVGFFCVTLLRRNLGLRDSLVEIKRKANGVEDSLKVTQTELDSVQHKLKELEEEKNSKLLPKDAELLVDKGNYRYHKTRNGLYVEVVETGESELIANISPVENETNNVRFFLEKTYGDGEHIAYTIREFSPDDPETDEYGIENFLSERTYIYLPESDTAHRVERKDNFRCATFGANPALYYEYSCGEGVGSSLPIFEVDTSLGSDKEAVSISDSTSEERERLGKLTFTDSAFALLPFEIDDAVVVYSLRSDSPKKLVLPFSKQARAALEEGVNAGFGILMREHSAVVSINSGKVTVYKFDEEVGAITAAHEIEVPEGVVTWKSKIEDSSLHVFDAATGDSSVIDLNAYFEKVSE